MASYGDAFGFTPAEFYRLTLPQIAAYGRYMEDKAAAVESAGKGHARTEPMRSVDSLDELVSLFGSPESKEALMRRRAGVAQ